MLVRKQILLEESQALEAEKLAILTGVSMSEIHRRIFDEGIKIQKKKATKNKSKKMSGGELLLDIAKHAVHGPGNSEYDKYAYDWEYDKDLRDENK
jgi:hypothetical protein